MVVTRGQVLKLYKNLVTEASKFPSYNFRMYALRRVRDKFRENKHFTDKKLVEEQYVAGLESLDVIKRQVVIGNIFKSDQLIIEKIRNKSLAP